MDPLRSMMMSDQQSSLSSVVTVEEGMDCREANSRFFSFLNHESRLNIIISKTSTIISCKLDGQEIVVNQRQYNQNHETWAIGDRPFQKLNALPWNCHVRGAELMLTTSNGASSIMFELTRFNELNNIVKLKSIHLQHQATYFNLNNAKEKLPIDGHTLVVQCNGNMNRISVQNTKLLCQCNKKSSILPQSLIGDIPFELVHHDASMSSRENNLDLEDDVIVCDAVFSIESTCPLDFLQVQLRYHNRALVFESRSSPISGTNSTSNQNANVSSSTTNVTKAHSHDLPNFVAQQGSSDTIVSSVVSSQGCDMSSDSKQRGGLLSALVNTPATSSGSKELSQNSINYIPSSTSHPSTIIRTRIRVTNFGVCIMPIMMTNYTCSYRFSW